MLTKQTLIYLKKTLLVTVLTALCAIVAVAVVALTRTAVDRSFVTGTANAESIVVSDANERVEAEVVALRPDGFHPTEITRSRGKFILALSNRSGMPDPDVGLEGGPGARMDVRIAAKKASVRKPLNLPPGTYTLSVNGRPEWTCRVTITTR